MTGQNPKTSSSIRGVGFLVLGMLIFSLQDIVVKWIGGDYPVLEIVAFRSVVALPLTLFLFRLEGGRGLPTTQRHKLEYVRGLFYFLSYTHLSLNSRALWRNWPNRRRQVLIDGNRQSQ